MKRWPVILLIVLSSLGLIDSLYLTFEHYSNSIPPCSTNPFVDCGKVLRSSYSEVQGIPLALLGSIHYFVETAIFIWIFLRSPRSIKYIALLLTTLGFLFSAYFVYLQLGVIKAICLYCMASAIISTLLVLLTFSFFPKSRKLLTAKISHFLYTTFLKRLLFKINPETIHEHMTKNGRLIGELKPITQTIEYFYGSSQSNLKQDLLGMTFVSPIGLAAGFDYEAQLTQTLPSLGFGFETVGTITNHPYAGNPRPRLGRLPKSKSLMVNKGFKNLGASETINRLTGKRFSFPVGVSIGRTNSIKLATVSQSITDICQAYTKFENSSVKHSYYELNISCPNLVGNVNFYSPKHLDLLLTKVDQLHLSRPLFVKMPIDQTNANTLKMLSVIAKHSPKGVIFGNLQKNRSHPSLDPSEVAQFPIGYFSGKPCFDRSNELISLCYKHYKKRFLIIGCGGVFSASDAYEKIARGATLVQLITGMIYEGPQLISLINFGLADLLQADGFTHVSQAIGKYHK